MGKMFVVMALLILVVGFAFAYYDQVQETNVDSEMINNVIFYPIENGRIVLPGNTEIKTNPLN